MSELNPVLIQAQNIDLKQRLDLAERRIRDLQVAASQSTVHVISGVHSTKGAL